MHFQAAEVPNCDANISRSPISQFSPRFDDADDVMIKYVALYPIQQYLSYKG